ncbi:MAG TPA: CoA transferase, partial [Ktedonobacteraceae bacterium]
TKKELMEVAIRRKLLMAPICTIQDLAESPHLAAREFWRDVEGSDGRRRRLPGPFARTNCDAFSFTCAAPRLGEHNQEVYTRLLGLSLSDLGMLARQGVI